MILKKFLKTGQATLEYFILLALVAGITLVSVNTFLPKLRETLQGTGQGGYSKKVADRIIGAAGDISSILVPPIPIPPPINIPNEPALQPMPPHGGVPASDPIKKKLFVNCPGLIYYQGGIQSGGDPRLKKPIELKPGEGAIIQYNSDYATQGDFSNKLWQILMSDVGKSASDFDLLVKYSGEDCEHGAPTMEDYNTINNDPNFENGTNGFYISNGSGENENVQVALSGVSTGCIFVMIVNAGEKEDKINLEIKEFITDDEGNRVSNPDTGKCFKKN